MAWKCSLSIPEAHTGGTRTWAPGRSKGEINVDEDPERAARREFAEELGRHASVGTLRPLGEIRQRGGKRVIAFLGKSDFDPMNLISNSFEIEWPPRSGRRQAFPEVDRAEWFAINAAKEKILPAQATFLERMFANKQSSTRDLETG
jgi:predicted NUDIX family NTP pyrophosphohydrolase